MGKSENGKSETWKIEKWGNSDNCKIRKFENCKSGKLKM